MQKKGISKERYCGDIFIQYSGGDFFYKKDSSDKHWKSKMATISSNGVQAMQRIPLSTHTPFYIL